MNSFSLPIIHPSYHLLLIYLLIHSLLLDHSHILSSYSAFFLIPSYSSILSFIPSCSTILIYILNCHSSYFLTLYSCTSSLPPSFSSILSFTPSYSTTRSSFPLTHPSSLLITHPPPHFLLPIPPFSPSHLPTHPPSLPTYSSIPSFPNDLKTSLL